MGSENFASAQSIGMNFIGFLSVNDTIEFSNYSNYYAVVSDTLVLTVPSDEVWYVQSSMFSMNFPTSGYKGITETTTVGQYCNCISLDGNVLHSAVNSQFYDLYYSSSAGTNYPKPLNSAGNLNYLRKVTDFFDYRIPLLTGNHTIIRSFVVYSSYSYAPIPKYVHSMIFEKYQIVQ